MNTVLIHNLRCISLWKACENKDKMNVTLNFDLHQLKQGICSQTAKCKKNFVSGNRSFLTAIWVISMWIIRQWKGKPRKKKKKKSQETKKTNQRPRGPCKALWKTCTNMWNQFIARKTSYLTEWVSKWLQQWSHTLLLHDEQENKLHCTMSDHVDSTTKSSLTLH